MKALAILVSIMICHVTLGQERLCRTDILNSLEVSPTNQVNELNKHDFSKLWLESDDAFTFGIIGEEHQRIFIKFLSIEQNANNPNAYSVKGKSKVKDTMCDFSGTITLSTIQEIVSENYGVDDEYKDAQIKLQGLLTARYEFFENKDQDHSGYFSGTAQSLFYIDKDDAVRYNDISSVSDGYFNNAFVGTWKMYQSDVEKVCNWGDYRVPHAHCDFDIGAGDFSVAEKYWKNGWLDLTLKKQAANGAITKQEANKESKKWWE